MSVQKIKKSNGVSNDHPNHERIKNHNFCRERWNNIVVNFVFIFDA